MRKKLVPTIRDTDAASRHDWLELERVARVEVSSEAEGYPVEGALLNDGQRGWRANEPGIQTVRLLFDHSQTIRLIRVVFKEEKSARTQEFMLRWLAEGTDAWKDIVRQQWNFSPPQTAIECEEYKVDLPWAGGFEITICPDISGGDTRASLESLQLSARP